jgi:hypothetical protein
VSQQINLYQPILRRQRKVFSAVTMLELVAVALLGLGLLYGFGRSQEASVRRDIALLEGQRLAAQGQVDALALQLAARRDVSALTQELQQAEQTLAAKRRLQQWLASQGADRAGGFAGHVEGLARQHRPGLQLAAIGIASGGRQLRLAGSTVDAAELVRYLGRLGAEPAFRGIEFRSVQIERASGVADRVEFVVDSERQEATP